MRGHPYILTVETNVEETEETVVAIAAVTLIFFIILVVGFLLLNKRLSIKLWTPFRNTLTRLKSFDLGAQAPIIFEPTDTLEFQELNTALHKLLEHNIAVFRSQKEFTENASHELQTPLAIIKNKLDLLLQQKQLTEEQYHIIEDINRALSRSVRINKNLLLLAKIENLQYDDREELEMGALVQQCIDVLQEHAEQKALTIEYDAALRISVIGNRTLLEILINNIIMNAIRHNVPGGILHIQLSTSGLSTSNSGHHPLDSTILFNRFAGIPSEHSGSGLGLSIIKQICKRYQWDIDYHFENNLHYFNIRF